ncbi:MAG: RteC domain-containing protein [Prevotella sp.]|nr:RteC domain-containing protein [Prevotella sp.]
MTYSILTDTDFFRAAQNGNTDEIIALYSEFIGKVIEVCSRTNDRTTAFATLLYTEIELKRMGDNEVVAKALEFITEMQKMVERTTVAAPVGISSAGTGTTDDEQLSWTEGSTSLVELAYGLMELGCFNKGKVTVEKIGNKLFKAFGMNPIVYTRTYINIKNRNSKDGYRTYFLTKLRNAMEQRIDNDIRKSLRR